MKLRDCGYEYCNSTVLIPQRSVSHQVDGLVSPALETQWSVKPSNQHPAVSWPPVEQLAPDLRLESGNLSIRR